MLTLYIFLVFVSFCSIIRFKGHRENVDLNGFKNDNNNLSV